MKFLFLLYVYAVPVAIGLIIAGSIGCYVGFPTVGGIAIFLGVLMFAIRVFFSEGINFQ